VGPLAQLVAHLHDARARGRHAATAVATRACIALSRATEEFVGTDVSSSIELGQWRGVLLSFASAAAGARVDPASSLLQVLE
jgi:hypothetical protein